ncbi:MAG TPA: L-seryl-tRNA(Sec) selenium transferase [Deltaproteobacteria bacterium]|nr:L-seryl-tRNA(Sec) selenium transferase [Deltaproteobacteria bacterium]
MDNTALRRLPSVDGLLRRDTCRELVERHGVSLVTAAAREVTAGLRSRLLAGEAVDVGGGEVERLVAERVERLLSPRCRPVVNATGTLMHSNLGRAVLASDAVEALQAAAAGPVALEFDLESGARGERDAAVEELLTRLTGAEAACVVNNNAAAVLIVLDTLAAGREVVVSRGELVEIGGSFRLPDIIEKSGAVLRETGTTNRTHLRDYAGAVSERTALLLKVHRSNFEVRGFTAEVPLADLVGLGRSRALPVVEDLGSGSLVDLSAFGLGREPVVAESIGAGADIVTFSGDKLLGGPQAGLVVGRRELVGRIKRNPLKRALRCDKLTLSALEATLRLYLRPESLRERLPVLAAMTMPFEETARLAERLRGLLAGRLGPGFHVSVRRGETLAGSGALPGFAVETALVAVRHDRVSPQALYRAFLRNDPPIAGRVKDEMFLLDPRCAGSAEACVPSPEVVEGLVS